MRISDWSSDVCSSDLPYELSCSAVCGLEHGRGDRLGQARAVESDAQVLTRVLSARVLAPGRAQLRTPGEYPEIRCDRNSVAEGKSVSVRVDLGGCCII